MNSSDLSLDVDAIRAQLEHSIKWQFQGLNIVQVPPAKIAEPDIIPHNESSNLDSLPSSLDFASWKETTKNCRSCDLHAGRKRVVFGSGSETADLFVVLPAPTKEVESGSNPFAGASGALLGKMLQAINLDLAKVYASPILKCSPRTGRKIEDSEIEACFEHLQTEIAHIQPKFVLAMGELAAQTLLRTDAALANLRGQWEMLFDLPLLCTWDTDSLLQRPELKKEAWTDLKKLMARME